jgi:hypothetical protein
MRNKRRRAFNAFACVVVWWVGENWVVAGRSGALNLREQPSTSARVVARYAPGTLLDNLGCRRGENRIWCDVQELGGGPRGFVAADYLKPAASPDERVATGPDDPALRAGQGHFDATGQISCARSAGLHRIQVGDERHEIPDAVLLGGNGH